MRKDAEPLATVHMPLDVWEKMMAAGELEERSGRYMVIRACKNELERLEQEKDK